MKKLTAFLLLVLAFTGLQAQDDSTVARKKSVPNMATLTTMDGKVMKGWLYQIDDNHIVLLDKANKYGKKTNPGMNAATNAIQIDQVKSLSLRKKNSVMKGLLIGLGTGIATGAIIGLASGSDPVQPYYSSSQDPLGIGNAFVAFGNSFALTAGEKAAAGAVGLGALGAITGAIIGAVAHKKFIIGGNKQRVRDLDAELKQRLLVQ